MLNDRGEVIGVAVAQFKGGQNLNFAIPSSDLTSLLRRMGAVASLPAGRPRREEKPAEYGARRINAGLGIKGGWFLPTGGETNVLKANGATYGADYRCN